MTEHTVIIENVGPVNIYRKKLATRIKITIKPGGEVRVSIPWAASFQTGEKFLIDKQQWIVKTLEKLARRPNVSKLIAEGNIFTTRNFRYEVAAASVPAVRIRYSKEEKVVCLEYPKEKSIDMPEIQKNLKKVIEGVLRFEAKRFLPVRTAELASKMGFQINRVTIKNNKTNWGSCSNLKNINLNLHLMRLPDRVIDFIIVHELVHTVIPNHGAKFKATMKRYFPDANELEKEVKKIRPESFS